MNLQGKQDREGDNDGSGSDKFVEVETHGVFLFRNPLAVKRIKIQDEIQQNSFSTCS